MLALAKDITQEIPTHPQESEIPELKEYIVITSYSIHYTKLYDLKTIFI